MGFWYSKNAKLMFRAEYPTKQGGSSSIQYGAVHNGENFTATDGTTGTYLYFSSQTYYANSTLAKNAARSSVLSLFIDVEYVGQNCIACLDNNEWDDSRYGYTGIVTGLTITSSQTFPGSTILSITNTTTDSKSFNSLVWNTTGYLANSLVAPSEATQKTLLRYAYIFDNNITLAAGQTLTVSFTT